MIEKFVKSFMDGKHQLEKVFSSAHPESYMDIIKAVIDVISDDEDYAGPDKNRIHEIDDGSYQGTLVYVIARKGYQPNDYWYVKVAYGSCSGCDTLEAIHHYSNEPPTEEQVRDYITLCLHVVQGLKKMGDIE